MDGQTKQPHREPASPGTPAIDPAAWRAEDMLATDDWIHTLSDAEIHDLMNAVTKAELQGIAIKDAPASRIEALDMGRRGLHNDGAEMLRDNLKGKIDIDDETARRLFTLVCVLHIRA